MRKGIQNARYRELIEVLVRARKSAGMSQSELASRLSTHQQFVSRFETGERRLDVTEFLDVAAALNIDAVSLLRLSTSRPESS